MTRNTHNTTAADEDQSETNDNGTGLSVSERELDETVLDVHHESGASLLVQPGNGGYQLDAFWENNTNQSNTWVTYTDGATQSGYDNCHDRDITGDVVSDPERVVITDPEPRGENVGYDESTLEIQFVDEVGFSVKLYWVNDQNEERKSIAITPLYDPRETAAGERTQFYDIIEYNQSDFDVEKTVEIPSRETVVRGAAQ